MPPPAPGQLHDRGHNRAVPLGKVIAAPVSRYIVGIFGVQEIVQVGGPGVIGIERQPSHSPFGFKLERVISGFPVVPKEGGTDKLRIGSPVSRKGDETRPRLVDVQRIIQTMTARPDVGNTESRVGDLSLDTQVELVNHPVLSLSGIAADALRRYSCRREAAWKRLRKSKKWLAVFNPIVISLTDLKRSTR